MMVCMKKYLFIVLLIGVWSCEDEKDTTPPVNKWWEDYLDNQYLDLGSDSLGGEIPSEIWDMGNLLGLNLYNNQLTGSIPSEIGNLTNLTSLNLFNNQLTGSIPPEIGTFTSMTMLKLQDNQLNGDIPESICELNITWSDSNRFRLYKNQFCPPYPSCIEDYVGEQDTSDCN
jgi:hypothetical protein